MISDAETARAVVDKWLGTNGRTFRYEHLSTKRDARGWVLVFAVFSADGYEIDGPCVLIVNPASGEVLTDYE